MRVIDRARASANDSDRLVAYLPAVAVGAVEEVSAPALAGAGNVGKLVDRPSREEEPSRSDRAAFEAQREAVADLDNPVADDLDPVAPELRPRLRRAARLGGIPSRDRKPCMWAAGAFRGSPASITATRRLARPSTRAALRPAAPPPTTTTSYVSVFMNPTVPRPTRGDQFCCCFWETGVAWPRGRDTDDSRCPR